MDKDKSGEIDYNEFVEQLYRMKSSDAHTLLVFIKHYVTEVRQHVIRQLRIMKELVQDQNAKHSAKIDAIVASLPLAAHSFATRALVEDSIDGPDLEHDSCCE